MISILRFDLCYANSVIDFTWVDVLCWCDTYLVECLVTETFFCKGNRASFKQLQVISSVVACKWIVCLLRLLHMDLILVRQLQITLELNALILNGL